MKKASPARKRIIDALTAAPSRIERVEAASVEQKPRPSIFAAGQKWDYRGFILIGLVAVLLYALGLFNDRPWIFYGREPIRPDRIAGEYLVVQGKPNLF